MPLNRHERRKREAMARRAERVVMNRIHAANDPASELRICGASEGFEILADATPAVDGKPALKKFTMTAYTGAAMNVGFGVPVVVDLEGMSVPSETRPILFAHESREIVGHSTSIVKSAKSLKVAGVISGVGEAASEVQALAANGFPWQASIGASITPGTLDFIDAGNKVQVNGRTFPGPVYVARKTVLGEISFVPMGADGATSASVAAQQSKGIKMNFSQWLVAQGVDESTLGTVARAALQATFDREQAPPVPVVVPPVVVTATAQSPEVPDVAAQMRAAASAELARQADLRAYIAEAGVNEIDITANGSTTRVNLLQHAIAHNWNRGQVAEAAIEAMRKERGPGPAIIARSHDRDCTVEALQGAMILRAGGRLDHPAYQSRQAVAMNIPSWLRAGLNTEQKQRAMEFAHRYSTMSAVDLCREACRMNGVQASHNRNEMIQAAFSSGGSLTNIFTTNVNTILLATYMEAMDTTQGWVTEADVNDFKTNERPRVEIGPGLKKLPRGSEADHSAYGDKLESYRIARYAKQFQVDEQDMIDDNLGIFSSAPVRHGQAAARLRPDLVYAILLSNPTLTATGRELFNTTEDNLGSSSALSFANLKAGVSAMRLLRENSVNLNIRPTHLIVPPTLEWTAKELVSSDTIVIAGTAGSVTERGATNTLRGENMTLVIDSRLENGLTNPDDDSAQSGSASTWFMASNQVETIEVGYLAGTGRAPQVRSTLLTNGKWGMNWDINMDIGAKAMDWRGLRKTTA